MEGVKVGHTTHHENGTGVSVFLFEQSAIGAYWICGSAPASHELVALDPDNSVPHVFGLVFAGGSAYGLFSALGVMKYLTEKSIGHPTKHGVVPIVPAAAIYDLNYKNAIAPTAEDAYQACISAHENNFLSGRIGAGTGATVGKIVPNANPMTGGLGCAQLQLPNGIFVVAYAIVNCIGDVMDRAGRIVAGAQTQNRFVNCANYLISGQAENDLFTQTNTTLAVVFTNAKFAKDELKRLSKMAIAGMARAISPVFTRYDGDILFFISVGDKVASDLTIGALAADAIHLAILNAVQKSEVVL